MGLCVQSGVLGVTPQHGASSRRQNEWGRRGFTSQIGGVCGYFFLLVVRPELLVAWLLLVEMPIATSFSVACCFHSERPTRTHRNTRQGTVWACQIVRKYAHPNREVIDQESTL